MLKGFRNLKHIYKKFSKLNWWVPIFFKWSTAVLQYIFPIPQSIYQNHKNKRMLQGYVRLDPVSFKHKLL